MNFLNFELMQRSHMLNHLMFLLESFIVAMNIHRMNARVKLKMKGKYVNQVFLKTDSQNNLYICISRRYKIFIRITLKKYSDVTFYLPKGKFFPCIFHVKILIVKVHIKNQRNICLHTNTF